MNISPVSENAFNEFTSRGWIIIHATRSRPSNKTTHMAIKKTFTFENFKAINSFLKHLTETIVSLNHHPDIDFQPAHKKCTLTLTTHAAGHTLSEQDLIFIQTLEKVS